MNDETMDKIIKIYALNHEVAYENGSMDELLKAMADLLGKEKLESELKTRVKPEDDKFGICLILIDIVRETYGQDPDYKKRMMYDILDSLDEHNIMKRKQNEGKDKQMSNKRDEEMRSNEFEAKRFLQKFLDEVFDDCKKEKTLGKLIGEIYLLMPKELLRMYEDKYGLGRYGFLGAMVEEIKEGKNHGL